MKRSLILLCAAVLLATLPLARVAEAAKPTKPTRVTKHAKPAKHAKHDKHAKCDKHGKHGKHVKHDKHKYCKHGKWARQVEEVQVEIFHVIDVLDFGSIVFVFGRVIEVPQSEVAAHEAHGDSVDVDFTFMSADIRDGWELVYGIDLGDANAIFSY